MFATRHKKLTFLLIPLALFTSASVQAQTYTGPIVITKGGTYTGNWTNGSNPKMPVVMIKTAEPVIIENCNVKSNGSSMISTINDSIPDFVIDVNVTVRNCNFYGSLHPNLDVQYPEFFKALQPKNILIENNYLEHTRGIYINGFHGDGSVNQSIKIMRNVAKNMDGRTRSGLPEASASFALLNAIHSVPNIEIAWNQIINEPRKSSVGDNLNLFETSGTSTSPVRLHNNYVQGAYHSDPTSMEWHGTGFTTDGDWDYSFITGYAHIYKNQFVSTCNAGINNVSGQHVKIYENRTVTSGLLPDGTQLKRLWAGIGYGNYNSMPLSLWIGNETFNNVSGYALENMSGPYKQRQDIEDYCVNSFPNVCYSNTSLPNPITVDTEKNEWLLWNKKLNDQAVKVGSSVNGSNGASTSGLAGNYAWGGANGGTTSPPTPTGTDRIIAKHSNKCIEIANSSVANSAEVIQQDCGSQTSEAFTLVAASGGTYFIKNKNSGLCLNVGSSNMANGAKVQQYTCADSNDQKFTIKSIPDGFVEIVALHSGKCLEVSGGGSQNGALIQQWGCVGAANQHWKLESGTPPTTPTQSYVFLRGINFNGTAVNIDNNSYGAGTGAANLTLTGANSFANQGVSLIPAVSDTGKAQMIRSSIYGQNLGVAVGGLANGQYRAFIYVWEDNNPATYDLLVEGFKVLQGFNSGSAGAWKKIGPYDTTVSDGALNLNFVGQDSNFLE